MKECREEFLQHFVVNVQNVIKLHRNCYTNEIIKNINNAIAFLTIPSTKAKPLKTSFAKRSDIIEISPNYVAVVLDRNFQFDQKVLIGVFRWENILRDPTRV